MEIFFFTYFELVKLKVSKKSLPPSWIEKVLQAAIPKKYYFKDCLTVKE